MGERKELVCPCVLGLWGREEYPSLRSSFDERYLPRVGDRGLILPPDPNPMEVHAVSLGLEKCVLQSLRRHR